MERHIFYIVNYIIEAIIFGFYARQLFTRNYSKIKEYALICICYLILFLLSLLYSPYINLLGFLVLHFILLLYMYGIRWYLALFHSLIITLAMSFSEIIVMGLLSYTNFGIGVDSENWIQQILMSLIIRTVYLLIISAVSLGFNKNKNSSLISKKEMLYLLLIPLVSISIIFIFVVLIMRYPELEELNYLIAVNSILITIINIIVFWIYRYTQLQNDKNLDLQLQLQKEYDEANYYRHLQEQDENQKILIHDIKRHLQSIDQLISSNQIENAANYIKDILSSDELNSRIRICDNELLNIIFNRYTAECTKRNIYFRPDIRCNSTKGFSDKDITSLFCNLLDNAIEACNDPDSYIEISCSINENLQSIVINTINSCNRNPFTKDHALPSSKKSNIKRHGIGLKSIKKIVSSYNGDIEMFYNDSDKTFRTIILLPQK